jgi:condensin complex subunit 1
VIETIKFFVILKTYGIKDSEIGIRKMLALIWSKERNVQIELILAFWHLFLSPDCYTQEKQAYNLIGLFKGATLSELTSLEELISHVLTAKQVAENASERSKEAKLQDVVF